MTPCQNAGAKLMGPGERSCSRLPGIATVLPMILLLVGCASTTILSRTNPSGDDPMSWTDFVTLPVQVLGHTPTHSQSDIAKLFPAFQDQANSGRHIVLYVNAAKLPSQDNLCSDTSAFQEGAGIGESANVTGALCDGSRIVTTATGVVRTAVPNARWLMRDFAIIRDQLYQSLAPNPNPKYS